MRSFRFLAGLGAVVATMICADAALAQKAGGILKIYHRDSPPSGSMHEESTTSTAIPFMGVFNNLVLFDQKAPQNRLDNIQPDLATSWSWNDDRTRLTFRLREGVQWHDGKPFTARDVQCTWDMLQEKSEALKLRKNPRDTWYANLDKVTTEGDHEAVFHLKRAQPAFLALLASGYSPVYPCHVSPRDMRVKPVGTGPFKMVEFRQNQFVKLAKNPSYWKPGRPYLDGIEYTIITNRSTRILAFIAGEFDMTWPNDVSIPLLKDIQSQAPKAVCQAFATTSRNVILNRDAPPFDNAEIREAFALTIDRKAFVDIIGDGQGDLGGAMHPYPNGVWGLPPDMLKTIPGYGDEVQKNRETARQIMRKLGYGPDNKLKMKVSTRNIAIYRDPAVILVDQLREIYMDAELETVETASWFSKIARKDYTVGMNTTGNGVDDPDAVFYEGYTCGAERNYSNYCNKEVEAMFDRQSMEADQEKRKKLVLEIDRRLQLDGARPIIFYERAGTCWQPHVKDFALMVNSSYNGWRFEDVWLDK